MYESKLNKQKKRFFVIEESLLMLILIKELILLVSLCSLGPRIIFTIEIVISLVAVVAPVSNLLVGIQLLSLVKSLYSLSF